MHQEKLLRFRQEAGCALTVLEQQLDCVRDLNAQVVKEAVDMPRWFQKPREHYILQGCVSSIEERIQQFLEMKEHAAELRSSVSLIPLPSTVLTTVPQLISTILSEH